MLGGGERDENECHVRLRGQGLQQLGKRLIRICRPGNADYRE